MTRKLLIVFASGFALAILSLGGAWVLGGAELTERVRAERGWGWEWRDDDRHRGRHRGEASRSFAFDGARILTLDMPATLRFTRGERREMTVSGPRNAVEALRWENGRLSLDDNVHMLRGLRISITAPQLVGVTLEAPADVELDGLDQPSFALSADGAVDLDARGKVGALHLRTSGAGDIDMEHVEARDARVRIDGIGDVDINASGAVDAEISGAGQVTLHRKPASLRARTSGLGGVDRAY